MSFGPVALAGARNLRAIIGLNSDRSANAL